MFLPLTNIARSHGYALAVHGSLQSDMDVVAVPWTSEAAPADVLMEAVRRWACKTMAAMFGESTCVHGPEAKPHGRTAWTLCVGGISIIDLSVMPLAGTTGEPQRMAVPCNPETQLQLAAVMLKHGTPEQQREALEYVGLGKLGGTTGEQA
jgi:hypothetical protein